MSTEVFTSVITGIIAFLRPSVQSLVTKVKDDASKYVQQKADDLYKWLHEHVFTTDKEKEDVKKIETDDNTTAEIPPSIIAALEKYFNDNKADSERIEEELRSIREGLNPAGQTVFNNTIQQVKNQVNIGNNYGNLTFN